MSYNYGLRPGATQKVSFTAASIRTANPLGSDTEYVRISATKACHVKIAAGGTQATAVVDGAVNSSATVNFNGVVNGLSEIKVGQIVEGTGITALRTVATIVSATRITLSGTASIDNDVVITFIDPLAPVAVVTDMYLPENEIEIVKCEPNSKIAAIRNTSASGDLFVTEMTG